MREIKFRFWTNNEMVVDSVGWNEDLGINQIFASMVSEYNMVIMQFTGLKDKNGI